MDPAADAFLSGEEGELLLEIARKSLEEYVLHGQTLPLSVFPLTERIKEKHGAFVTLRRKGELRGCIGYIKGTAPLADTVRDNAINAAAHDPRFAAVKAQELSDITIEVSALCPGLEPGSPFFPVEDIGEIVLGRDGLYLECAHPYGAGLLLPQVPIEQGWSLDQFLSGLCHKAGVPERAWERPGSKLYRFSAQVFSEQES